MITNVIQGSPRGVVCALLATLVVAAGTAVPAWVQAQDLSPPPAPVANNLGPEQLVQDSAKRMLTELDANRAMYAKDPAKLDALVANVLLPNFDSDYAARLVLGQTWRTATPEQRKRFVDAFYHSLLRNYGNALLNFTADKFVILPYRGEPGETQATVRTEVKKDTGEKVPVNFSLHKTPDGWKAWDVVIEGISYVKSFRTDFAAEIQQKGLDEVIARLEKERYDPDGRSSRIEPVKPSVGTATFEPLGAERARVVGSLEFATVARLLVEGSAAIDGGQAASIDLGAVTGSDSSGLALLIEWLSVAGEAGRPLRYDNVPVQLRQLARLSDVEELLLGGSDPSTARP